MVYGGMDLDREMKKMKKHREKYGPAMVRLMEIIVNTDTADFPLDIRDMKDIGIVLELVDIEYIRNDALVIKKAFNNITGVYLKETCPLTDRGTAFLEESKYRKRFRSLRSAFNNRQ